MEQRKGYPMAIDGVAAGAMAKFRPPSKDCDVRTYHNYCEHVIREDLTFDECRRLIAVFGCEFADLANAIVNDKLGKGSRRR
jgi:hypothetical protein